MRNRIKIHLQDETLEQLLCLAEVPAVMANWDIPGILKDLRQALRTPPDRRTVSQHTLDWMLSEFQAILNETNEYNDE